MKTQIRDAFLPGKASLPGLAATGRLRMTVFVILALLSLVGAPRAQAGPIEELVLVMVRSFNPFESLGFTNDTENIGGGGPLGKLYLAPPPGPLIKGVSPHASPATGTLYGTASLGGSSSHGTVFSINTDGTGFTVLHDFTGGADGAFPAAGLISDGTTLYGTTVNGGTSDNGTVFALALNGNGFTVLHNFTARNFPYTNSDGGNPYAALILSGNTLYGTTSDGGHGNAGTVFALNINTTNFTVLHHFTTPTYDANFILTNSDGANPSAPLILSGEMLYGTAANGGAGGAGAVFAVKTNGTNFTVLHSFPALDQLYFTNSDGISPAAGLILSGNTLFGTANRGGSGNDGTVFAVNTNGTGFTNLYNFTGGSDGSRPAGELVLSGSSLFGTTSGGGNASTGNGTVFAIDTNGKNFSVVHTFAAGGYDTNLPSSGNNLTNSDGAFSQAGLILSGNTFYGTASAGGTGANGTIFSLSVAQLPQPTILGITLSGTNLVINGANGQSGTYVTWMSTNLSFPLNIWTPVATNTLSVTGNFSLTATNAVDPKASKRFYILQTQ